MSNDQRMHNVQINFGENEENNKIQKHTNQQLNNRARGHISTQDNELNVLK